MKLHAPDPMGEAAHDAAMFASGLDFHLLAACSPNLSREQRAAALERAYRQWMPLCRAFAKLFEVAPNTAARAEHHDGMIRDFIEAKDAA